MPLLAFDDFKKLDIRVGKIVEAERIEGSDKLLKLIFDFGSEQRQIVAGIAQFVDPASLIGKEMPVLLNIEPRMLKGIESQGMILAVDAEGKAILLHPETEVPPGSIIR